MTTDDRARLEAVAAQCERMGIDDLRTVPVADVHALAAAIRAALAEPERAVARIHRWYREGREEAMTARARPQNLPDEGETAERWRLRGFLAEQRRQRLADLEAAHVSREDREAAILAVTESWYWRLDENNVPELADQHMAEARRLLKLDDA